MTREKSRRKVATKAILQMMTFNEGRKLGKLTLRELIDTDR